ncbi:hypothetical protein [Legionella quateirensis]|uniref:EthD domain-containing protein n=1 Tax=Legionella quateirensis TaxID=45072 RepID=A0A378KVU3_9GAMM|nr:hypothetical protein [Legionella quateirensis]KTD43413.1 hypothetical protein Lqua_3314 [Legionella quateirensis]STY18299.1 Uncharacterised protein [Legionella quateirensis]
MTSKNIIIVKLSVTSKKEAEFNEFYHHHYIPTLMKVVPELETARRYQEHNVDGTLRYYNKQFLTIYECSPNIDAQLILEAIRQRPGREQEKKEWEQFKIDGLQHLESACVYTQRYQHRRGSGMDHFGSRPFFMVSVEVKPEQLDVFDDWYENHYLPKNLADVPTWTGCCRYSSQGKIPSRQLTVYEADNLSTLQQSLELMRAPHRLKENASWKQWDTGNDPVITWEDATSFKPIFRYPD